MSVPTYGERLFERYLNGHDVRFQREPELPGIPELMDFVLDHADCGKILLDVKDIDVINHLKSSFSELRPE